MHRGHRSEESIEFRKARTYCFRNSKYDPKLQENIFTGKPEDLELFVAVMVDRPIMDIVPDCPRGLVLSDNRCTGAFQ